MITGLGVLDVAESGFALVERAPAVSVEERREAIDAPVLAFDPIAARETAPLASVPGPRHRETSGQVGKIVITVDPGEDRS